MRTLVYIYLLLDNTEIDSALWQCGWACDITWPDSRGSGLTSLRLAVLGDIADPGCRVCSFRICFCYFLSFQPWEYWLHMASTGDGELIRSIKHVVTYI